MEIERIIEQALAEDLSRGDITTETIIPAHLRGEGFLIVKRPGVIAGMEIAARTFFKVDPDLRFEGLVVDGSEVEAGRKIALVSGKVCSILKAERTALNFLCRLSGIATATRKFVKAVEGTPVQILDTRKTVPGLRKLDKYAIRVGGGKNHRFSLGDGILIKDNHLKALKKSGQHLAWSILKLKQNHHLLKVEVEVSSLKEAEEAVNGGADILLLDNMSVELMAEVARRFKNKVLLEASGNITLENVRQVAQTGIHFISIGSLTHSPSSLDISLELE